MAVVGENGNPVPGASVRVFEAPDGLAATFVTDAAGECRIPRSIGPDVFRLRITATDATGAQQGHLELRAHDPDEAGRPLRVVLQAAREVTIRVTDSNSAAVGGAAVAILDTWGSLAEGRTAEDGSVRLRFPAGAAIYSVVALKSKIGFANWQSRGENGNESHHRLPREVPLVLQGAQTVRVRAVDSGGKPIAGVAIYPWGISAPRPQRFSDCRLIDVLTADNGVATFDWMPINLRSLKCGIRSDDYALPARVERQLQLAFANGDRELTALLLRRTQISGRVVGPNGKPAAGIMVLAQGTDNLASGQHEAARTADDGTYSMKLVPTHVYVVGVADDDWAAVNLSDVAVDEGQPVADLDLKLIKGTVIRGAVTVGDETTPWRGRSINVTEADLLPVRAGQKRPGTLRRSAPTDAKGQYRIRVAPGNYILKPLADVTVNQQSLSLIVSDEPEIVQDLHLVSRQDDVADRRGDLTGTVIGPDDKPVGGATILGCYATYIRGQPRGTSEIKSASDDSGEFKLERLLAPMWLFVWSSDGAWGGKIRVEADQESATLKLAPSAQAVGRLIDGEAPIAGEDIKLTVAIATTGPTGRPVRSPFQVGSAKTTDDGRFVLSSLIVGTNYTIGIGSPRSLGGRGERSGLNGLNVERPGTVSLGYIDAPAMRTAKIDNGVTWHHIDIAARIANRFALRTDLATRISVALADAKHENRRVLLLIGDREAQATQIVFRVLERLEEADDPAAFERQRIARRGGQREPVDELAPMLAGFNRVYVNVSNREAIAYLARAYRLDTAKVALPALLILADDGAVAEQKSFAPAGDPPQMDMGAVREFVKRHTLPGRDAQELFRDAARRAREEGKLILLQQSGHKSYASRLFTRFIDRHRKLLERDYVYLDIDPFRMTNGGAVISPYRQTGDNFPWLAILNADGVKIADSDSPSGNIGFPSEPEEIDYFIEQMLKPTARHLTDEDRDKLRSALREWEPTTAKSAP